MTQENQSTQPQTGPRLVPPRSKLKTGLPTEGLMILVGQPKSGKTTFSASFPNSYLLELEPSGGDRVEGRIHDIPNLDEFRQILKAAVTDPSIQTIIVDSVDVLSDWMEEEVAKSRGLEMITERKAGVDGFEMWADYRKRIEAFINFLKTSRKLVIMIAHCKEPKLDTNGNLVSPAGINMPGKAGAFLAAQADMIGFCFKKPLGTGTAYFVTFQGGPLGMWGSRVEELNDKVIQLPRENPYSAFEAVFKNSKPADETKQSPQPTGGKK
jgi:hypothetical protein